MRDQYEGANYQFETHFIIQQQRQPDMSDTDQQSLKSQQKSHPENPMMKLLKSYHQKLQGEQQQCKTAMSALKQKVRQLFEQQFQLQFNIFQKQFYKQKHDLSTQIKTIQYYLQNFLQKHSLNPRQNNLYPLFNEIDIKLTSNLTYISNKFALQFRYPQTKTQLNSKINHIKAQIMEKQLEDLRSFLAHNQNIRKYCNKELSQIKDIHDAYRNIFAIAEKKYFTPELNFTGTIEQAILTLKLSKNIQKLSIGIRKPSGKMPIHEYKQLIDSMLKSKNLLTHVNLKVMDMEFEEQKCQLIKGFVKELKVLKNFKLQNYYKQNKLGMFEDFSWYPLKKETHVIGKVW